MESNQQAAQNQHMLEQMKQQTIMLQAEEERKTLQMKIQMEMEAQMQLKQMEQSAKMEMNERTLQSKESIEAMKSEDKRDEIVFNRMKDDDSYEREHRNNKEK